MDKAAQSDEKREPAFADDLVTALARRLANGETVGVPRRLKKRVDEAFLRVMRERGERWL